ncbi:MAG: hypothetical protein R3E50_08180 [Halioglobus sp.]
MPTSGRIAGLAIAMAMFIFSLVMFVISGDWVAILFAAGSLAYFLFFLTKDKRSKP